MEVAEWRALTVRQIEQAGVTAPDEAQKAEEITFADLVTALTEGCQLQRIQSFLHPRVIPHLLEDRIHDGVRGRNVGVHCKSVQNRDFSSEQKCSNVSCS